MKRKTASELFKQVDPELKVILGGTHYHRKGIKLKDWEKTSGVFCPECGQEVVRLLNGLCPECWKRKNYEQARAMEYIAMALTYRPEKRKSAAYG